MVKERAPSLELVSVPIKRNSFAIKGGFLRFLDLLFFFLLNGRDLGLAFPPLDTTKRLKSLNEMPQESPKLHHSQEGLFSG